MFEIKDQMNRVIHVDHHPPMRIISLVPSQTELLHYLGLEDEVTGITKFCVHPRRWFENKVKVGGTKNVNIKKIRSLEPDLIIANKEENTKEQIEELEKIAPVWISDVNNLEDALEMIRSVGELVGKEQKAETLIAQLETNFSTLNTLHPQPLTSYFIWRKPYMVAGGDTFIGDMLRRCGFQNVFEKEKRYPEISLHQLASSNHQLILLSSEPYPFKEIDLNEIHSQLPNTKILMVDGEMFSWYGSRMLLASHYFNELINHIYTNLQGDSHFA